MKKISREEIIDKIKKIVFKGLKNYHAQVYLFGSWARGEEKRTSDIDVAIEHNNTIKSEIFSNIRLLLEESNIPYKVDIVDLSRADKEIFEKVKKEGILWKDYKSELK